MRPLKAALLFCACALRLGVPQEAAGAPVRPAPNLALSAGNASDPAAQSINDLRGLPVILLLTDSPKNDAFLRQIREIEKAAERFAIRKTVFATGIVSAPDATIKTTLPLRRLAAADQAFQLLQIKDRHAIVLLGPDGNIDYQTAKVLSANRILEVLQNSAGLRQRIPKAG